jgi:hypothetical protein
VAAMMRRQRRQFEDPAPFVPEQTKLTFA